jgi:hypothetical protein
VVDCSDLAPRRRQPGWTAALMFNVH